MQHHFQSDLAKSMMKCRVTFIGDHKNVVITRHDSWNMMQKKLAMHFPFSNGTKIQIEIYILEFGTSGRRTPKWIPCNFMRQLAEPVMMWMEYQFFLHQIFRLFLYHILFCIKNTFWKEIKFISGKFNKVETWKFFPGRFLLNWWYVVVNFLTWVPNENNTRRHLGLTSF